MYKKPNLYFLKKVVEEIVYAVLNQSLRYFGSVELGYKIQNARYAIETDLHSSGNKW